MSVSTSRSPVLSAGPSRHARATVLAAAALTIMAAAIISPSLPGMRTEFAATPGADLLVRLAVTVTSLAIAVTAPISGRIADRFGYAPLLVGGLLLYAVSGTAGYFLDELPVLLVSRVVLGIAVGAVMTAVSTALTHWYDGARRARWLGWQQASARLGGVVFLPLAGLLAAIDWRAPFWIYAVAAVLALAATTALRDQRRDHQPAPSSVRRPMHSRTRPVLGIYAFALAATLAFYMAPTQLPFLLAGGGVSPAAIGTVIAGSTLTSAAGALAFPALRSRLSSASLTGFSIALLGVGWIVVGSAAFLPQVMAGLLIGGFGVGVVVPHLSSRLGDLAAPEHRGRILAGLVTAIFLGQFLSPLLLAPLVWALGTAGAFAATGITLLAGSAVTLVHGRKKNITQKGSER